MQLSRHDLLQLDEASLNRLSEEQLRVLSVKLVADLQAVHERLAQNSRNSSRPPSSEPPWQGKGEEGTDASDKGTQEPGAQDRDEEKPAGEQAQASSKSDMGPKQARSTGQQPGAPGHGRTQSLAIDHEERHHPEQYAVCGAGLCAGDADRIHSAALAIDLRETSDEHVGLEVLQTKHIYHERHCACGHWTRAEPGHCAGDEHWRVALAVGVYDRHDDRLRDWETLPRTPAQRSR